MQTRHRPTLRSRSLQLRNARKIGLVTIADVARLNVMVLGGKVKSAPTASMVTEFVHICTFYPLFTPARALKPILQ
jgi:hypothetical protein